MSGLKGRKMKIWVDDVRPAPDGYEWCKSVHEAVSEIVFGVYGRVRFDDTPVVNTVEVVDLDHDAGEYYPFGGDYINILRDLERLQAEENRDFSGIKFHIHSMNPVGVENMRQIIRRNGWEEV